MRFGLFASVVLHLAIVGAGFWLPQFITLPDVTSEPYIPLDLIAEAELDLTTSVPAAAPEPVEEEPEPDLPEPQVEEPEPAPAEEAAEPENLPEPEPEPEPVTPEPEPVEPEVDPEPTPEPPKETPEPPVKKPEPKEEEPDLMTQLENELKNLDPEKRNTPTSQTPSQTTETADKARSAIGAGDRLTASDEAKMRAAIQRCWNAGTIIGAPEPEKLIVVIDFELNRDGTLASSPRVVNELQINLSGNQFWRVAQREALSAVSKCAPYDFLPVERYESWKEFRLNFNPAEMVGR
ncbi:hypothetical protein [Hyphococcus sp.]|uniref:hypothetical protein n=1 Tax=Hyphococcus sp. TaxID=2038636 RepID=UPI0035C6E381